MGLPFVGRRHARPRGLLAALFVFRPTGQPSHDRKVRA